MKKYDVVAVVGEYVNKDRQIKQSYKKVGELHESKDGRPFLLMDKSFNLMAVKQKNVNDERVILSLYEPKEKQQPAPEAPQEGWTQEEPFDDAIPF